MPRLIFEPLPRRNNLFYFSYVCYLEQSEGFFAPNVYSSVHKNKIQLSLSSRVSPIAVSHYVSLSAPLARGTHSAVANKYHRLLMPLILREITTLTQNWRTIRRARHSTSNSPLRVATMNIQTSVYNFL